MSSATGEVHRRDGIVVVVDGPAGAGKSTTVAALQDAWPRVWPRPLLAVGLDHATSAFGGSLERWWELIRRHEQADEAGEVRWGPLGRELVAGMHRAAAAWAHSGFDVAVEHVLLDRTTVSDLRSSLAGLEVFHLGLTCDPDVLEDRELERGGSPRQALAELIATADVLVRDLVLDTTEMTTEELVDTIVEHVDRWMAERGS